MSPCDVVVERIALGEPLGDLADHAASCPACRRIAALPTELGSLRREADPGLGFSARMTAGAQQRVVVRRRRRIAAAGIAATAATALMAIALTRHPESPTPTVAQPAADTHHDDPWDVHGPKPGEIDDDARALVRLADTDRALRSHANWDAIEKPLKPYSKLVKGVVP